jgi:hypothetical protein
MIYFIALIPATMLTIAGYFVLFLSNRSEGAFRAFGKYLGFWAFTLAGLVVLVPIRRGARPLWRPGECASFAQHVRSRAGDTGSGAVPTSARTAGRGTCGAEGTEPAASASAASPLGTLRTAPALVGQLTDAQRIRRSARPRGIQIAGAHGFAEIAPVAAGAE